MDSNLDLNSGLQEPPPLTNTTETEYSVKDSVEVTKTETLTLTDDGGSVEDSSATRCVKEEIVKNSEEVTKAETLIGQDAQTVPVVGNVEENGGGDDSAVEEQEVEVFHDADFDMRFSMEDLCQPEGDAVQKEENPMLNDSNAPAEADAEFFQDIDIDLESFKEDLLQQEGEAVAVQKDSGSEEQELVEQKKQKRKRNVEEEQGVRYSLPLFQKSKAGFSVGDLVWGKVRSHPWWPGQVFDPKDASEMAMKHKKKKSHLLVAYFGDKSFAWCEPSRLKAFEVNFVHMEKQSTLETCREAVDDALGEVERRVEVGMSCGCFGSEAVESMKCKEVENSGIREGTRCCAVDKSLVAGGFDPNKFLEYIMELAAASFLGADLLELAIVKAQLKVFCRSKGYPELPVFFNCGNIAEDDAEVLPVEIKKSGGGEVGMSTLADSEIVSGKRSRGRPRKVTTHVLENRKKKKSLNEMTEEDDVDFSPDGNKGKSVSRASTKKRRADEPISPRSARSKKKRAESPVELEPDPSYSTPAPKVGERIRRVASRLTPSPSVLKSGNVKLQSTEAKKSRGRGRPKGKDKVVFDEYSFPSDLLSQLCLAARDPMKGYSFLPAVTNFFTDFRKYYSSAASEDQEHVKSVGAKRGRKKKVANLEVAETLETANPGVAETLEAANPEVAETLETSMPDHMQDDFWPDVNIIVHSSPERETESRGKKRKGQSQKKRQNKKAKHVEEPSLSSPDPVLNTAGVLPVGVSGPDDKQEVAVERPNNSSVQNVVEECPVGVSGPDDKKQVAAEMQSDNSAQHIVDECTPTALILSFNEEDAIPSVAELIKKFSPYGPLREAQTEVQRKDKRAKVVFQRRADADVAFTSPGKYNMFGKALVSYRLRYLPPSPRARPPTGVHDRKETSTADFANSELAAQEGTGIGNDNA